ncbi:MAG: class I SAM-dependent methyltransferase [Candidatus Methanoperedens sp.]|nr:class I SAM-dependent methyltransferase [Candidatus Methanoperedens sp.]
MITKINNFIKYPLYFSPISYFEKIIVNSHFGGLIKCIVCGSISLINVKDNNLRETCVCIKCGSTNRQRQIAYVCLEAGLQNRKHLSSLKDFIKLDDFVVYNTEASGAIHCQLLKMKNYIYSEYFGISYTSGDIVNNIMHQDLMDMSFSNETIDLMISSDVFEHIPDPYKAHKEVYRVLKHGGRHIFTVPFYQTEFLDEDRIGNDNEGNIVHLKKPLYHEDPLRPEGALVYKIFSLEMLVKLRKIGFRTNLYHIYKPLYGILGKNAIVFEAIKE